MAIFTAGIIGGLAKSALDLLGGGIKSFFGYREKKIDLEIMDKTSDKELQIAWWDYLKDQKSMLINQVIRPLTISYFIGEYAYYKVFYGTYKIVEVIPAFSIGDTNIGPIYNGHILFFCIVFLFPLRTLEKWLRKE